MMEFSSCQNSNLPSPSTYYPPPPLPTDVTHGDVEIKTNIGSVVQIRGALERALMARRFRKEFVEMFIKRHIENTERRVQKVKRNSNVKGGGY